MDISACFQDAANRGGLSGPLGCLAFELCAAARSERVVLCAPVIFGGLPHGLDPAGPFESAEGGEERSGIDFENVAADLLDALGDAVAMHRLERERLQN